MKFLPITEKVIRITAIISFSICCFHPCVISQNRSDLEKKQKKIETQIKKTEKDLKLTKAQKSSTLKDLNTIQAKISDRKVIITGVKKDLNHVETKLSEQEELVYKIRQQVEKLKLEYSVIMRKAYKASLITNDWMLILSSSSMNQAFQRWQYLRNIKKQRKAQAKAIANTQRELEEQLTSLQELRYSNQILLDKEENQTALLSKDLNQKNVILSNLGEDEKSLVNALKKQKRESANIKNEIQRVIRLEIAKREKEARIQAEKKRKAEEARLAVLAREESAKAAKKNSARVEVTSDDESIKANAKSTIEKVNVDRGEKLSAKKNIDISETPESAALSADFQGNRGTLSWPVKRGAVVRGFGRQTHADLSHVEIINNGIDIKTDPSAIATSVFEGEVVHVAFIAGYKNTVMINHGKYYTVYSNLESVNVNKGQKVNKGTPIGNTGISGNSGNYELHFELWSRSNPINPLTWLKAR